MLVYDYVDRISGESVRICYTQSIIHKDYLLWLYQFFYDRGYTSNLQSREYIRVFKYKTYRRFEFNTSNFTSLGWINNLFYRKGEKKNSQ